MIWTGPSQPQPRPSIDWFGPDETWGQVVIAANGSHVPDRHSEADSEFGGAA